MFAAFAISVLAAFVCFATCEEECGPPHEVSRAQVSDSSDSSYVFGSTVTYKCDYGFTTVGTGKISRCVKDPATNELVWTKPEITCNPRSCGDPGFVTNSHRSGSRFTFPNHVEYICNEGYKLSGVSRRYCEASGVWSGRLPSCSVISCRRPGDLDNGRAVYTSLEYNSELTYECNNGLQLSSTQARLCGPDGEWTGSEPFCKESECELPDKPDFGTVELVGNKVKVGSIVIYKCNPGRKLVGSSSSKCIKTGEWTFPTPKCVEPCSVPFVRNGELGKYEEEYKRYRWRTVFKKVREGTTLDENEEVVLKCDDDYLPHAAQPLREITVTCLTGQLSPEPECISMSCLGDPPAILNGRAVVRSRQHGYTIWYSCDEGFEKGKSGSISCSYGSWTGSTPTCRDTRCNKESLNYPGLVKSEGFLSNKQSFEPLCHRGYEVTEKSDTKIYCNEGEWTGNIPPCTLARCKTESLLGFNGLILEGYRILDEGESLQPVCSEGFEFSNKNDSKIYCLEGKWEGNLPPCSPAHCFNDPPVPENGRIKLIRTIGHGTVIEYECFQHYVKDGANSVTCAYGKWTGSPPACKDSRCYPRNLPEKEGVDLTDDRPVYSNEKADIICKKGYSLRYPDIPCQHGEWQAQNKLSPCQENDCRVKYIMNGKMLIIKTVATRILGIQTGTKTVYEEVDIGTSESSGTILYVTCRNRYKFQGEEHGDLVEVTCRRGEWVPFPECLLSRRQWEGELLETNKKTTTVSPTIYPSVQVFHLNSNQTENLDANHSPEIAVVKDDSVGASLEDGFAEEFALSDNRTSEKAEEVIAVTTVNPPCSCKYNVQDNNLVAYDGKRLINFNDEVYSGSIVMFYCREPGFYHFSGPSSVMCPEDCSWHSAMFPSCSIPGKNEVTIRVYTSREEEKNINVGLGGIITVIPGTKLQLKCVISADYYFYGKLNWDTTAHGNGIEQQVTNQRTRSYGLLYMLSKASHRDSGTYICYQSNGSSRSVTIEVKDVQCPEITETEGVAISYAQNRSFDSRATFHCFSPYKRDGPSFVTCEASGLWSGPPASCYLPTCSVGSLYDVIPEGVVPHLDDSMSDNLPYGYILKLGCDQVGMALRGSNTATCDTDGKWKVGVGVQCIQGCASLSQKNGSELLIFPEKEFYQMGESIIFSCPEGKVLTEEVERILCFKSGWTPDTIPDCH